MAEDPKYTIKKIVDNITSTKDDNVTALGILYIYADGPEDLKDLFDTYDCVVTFEDGRTDSKRQMQEVPEHHPTIYPVIVETIDKYSAGVLVCTGIKIQHKMMEQMRTVIEAAAKGTGYRLMILNEPPTTRRVGGIKVWETTYNIRYTDI